MRTVRALAGSLAVVMLLPGIGTGQTPKPFKDAWFWGIKGGGFAYGDLSTNLKQSYKMAPAAGVDWLITRTHGGLYLSFSQAFLTSRDYVITNTSTSDTLPRQIDLTNVRRFDVAAMGFPGDNPRVRPYAGLGFTVEQVATAQPQGNYTTNDQYVATQSFVQQARTGFSPLVIVGSQFRLSVVSAFIQATASPAQKTQFLYNGKSFHVGYDIGLRYNIGSSIEREP